MTEPLAFALAAFLLLAAPGPTNTLVATSGASVGLQRSLHLVVAVTLGYLIATIAVALIVTPIVHASRQADIALRIVCGMYLFYAAWKLWREGAETLAGDQPVQFERVLIATSLNPKGIVFAFVIVPFLSPLELNAAPYLLALAAMAAFVAWAWIGVGAALRAGARDRVNAGLIRRVGAIVLCLFAALIAGSAVSV